CTRATRAASPAMPTANSSTRTPLTPADPLSRFRSLFGGTRFFHGGASQTLADGRQESAVLPRRGGGLALAARRAFHRAHRHLRPHRADGADQVRRAAPRALAEGGRGAVADGVRADQGVAQGGGGSHQVAACPLRR